MASSRLLKVFSDQLVHNQQRNSKTNAFKPMEPRAPKAAIHKTAPILLLISNQQTCDQLERLLQENYYSPVVTADLNRLLSIIRRKDFSIIFIDCAAVSLYGSRIISKIKVACHFCRIIFLCDRVHLSDTVHRNLVKDVLELGVYACIMSPYKEWEVISMVSHYF